MDNYPTGLTSTEANQKLKELGFNELTPPTKHTLLQQILEVFMEPMFILLLVSAALYFILGEKKEAFIMMIFVAFVAFIEIIQEWRTEKALKALKQLTVDWVTVIRDGEKKTVLAKELVPGDICLICEGMRIPADGTLKQTSGLLIDESILTGESVPVHRFDCDIVSAGTAILAGQAWLEIIYTGLNTAFGKIANQINKMPSQLSPLQKKTKKLITIFAVLAIILCLLVILLQFFYTRNWINSLLAGITLAMGIIPEEFPVVLAIYLSLGAFRMSRRQALIKKMPAVETLGSITVLCVDKTGTLTENRMHIEEVSELHPSIHHSLSIQEIALLASSAEIVDPMEKSIQDNVEVTRSSLIEKQKLIHLKEIPFTSHSRRVANVFKLGNKTLIASKGSMESILNLCKLNIEEHDMICEQSNQLAEKGLRIIAVADCLTDQCNEPLESNPFVFRGWIAFQDPPREGIREAIQSCHKAGVRVIMMTGDYSVTANAIGKQIGLAENPVLLSGQELQQLSEEELVKKTPNVDIVYRVFPEQKSRIIQSLQSAGEIVGMTGDGVNDAPALKLADIGIAMGLRGTEVAKESADMVLLDDNFVSIVKAIKDGRRIYNNIQKAISYVMMIHIPIAGLALLSPIFNLPQILLPIHIVLMELIIDPTSSIVYESEEAEPRLMELPPRHPKEALLNRSFTIQIILQGLILLFAVFLPFHYLVDTGFSVEKARSIALVILFIGNAMLVMVNRSSLPFYARKNGNQKNFVASIMYIATFLLVLAITYIPFMNDIVKTNQVPFFYFILAIVFGFLSTGWWECIKSIQYKKVLK
ncbi:MAG: cation-translocating P-type ATPase [Caldisericia bacterium]|nr:cation-translocating P-type ATPase [Caldisericia bacterium]